MFASLIRLFGLERASSTSAVASGAERRSYARAQVRVDVVVTYNGQQTVGQLRDVSISGAMLAVDLSLTVGDRLQLAFGRLDAPVQASVVRVMENGLGLAFDDPGIGVLLAGWSRGATPQVQAANVNDGRPADT